MKNFAYKFAICVALILGCLLPVAAQAQQFGKRHHGSGVMGYVDTGQFQGGLEPGIWTVRVSTDAGAPITSVETDENGYFEVALRPGDYELTPFFFPHVSPGHPVPNFVIIGPSTPVQVARNRFTYILLPTHVGTLQGTGVGLSPLP